jgi:hypothetical protein
MQYRYIVAFQLIGVIRPSTELEGFLVELAIAGARGRLTGDLDSLPPEVDQAAAVGRLLLQGILGQAGDGTPEERLSREVADIKQRRRKETGDAAFVVVEALGEVEDFNPRPQRELPGYVLALDNAPKKEIRARYESAVHGLLAALAIASDHLYGVKKVADEITFLRPDGKALYCYTLSGSANAYVSSAIPQDALPLIPRNAKTLSHHQSLVDAARLLSRSLAEDSDPLLSFLSVWSGLEIFVSKNFKDYDRRVLARLAVGSPPPVPTRIIERIRTVMSDKYRLTDKFSVIASELGDPGVEHDQATFEAIKLVRDKLLHGEDIPLASLPTSEAKGLLRKYLRLHVGQDVV